MKIPLYFPGNSGSGWYLLVFMKIVHWDQYTGIGGNIRYKSLLVPGFILNIFDPLHTPSVDSTKKKNQSGQSPRRTGSLGLKSLQVLTVPTRAEPHYQRWWMRKVENIDRRRRLYSVSWVLSSTSCRRRNRVPWALLPPSPNSDWLYLLDLNDWF